MEVLFYILRGIIAAFVFLTLLKNVAFLVVSPFYPIKEKLRLLRSLKSRKERGLGPYEPLISVIVPAWNEEVGIIKTMESIVHNGYHNTELIVVNDGSTDGTDKAVRAFITGLSKQTPSIRKVRYKSQKNGGKGSALNAGIKVASGEIILTVDADSFLTPGSLERLTRYYLDEKIMAVVGNVEVKNTRTIVGLAQELEYYFGFYNKRAHAVLNAEYIFGGACASFRASVFREIGLYDEKNKTEDIEITLRLRHHGMACTYAENVVCYTEGASDVKGLLSQRTRWKKGRFDAFRLYRSLFFSQHDSHNFFLSFLVLPLSLLAEFQLILEPIAVAILLSYSLMSGDYLSLAIGIAYIGLAFVSVSLFHTTRPRPHLVLLFPFIWPLFFFLDWVEFQALFKSVRLIRNKEDIVWQKWQRTGFTGAPGKVKA